MIPVKVNTDGGARGNPGPAASAFLVRKGDAIIFEDSKFLGNSTNNVAEYTAVILALQWLVENFKSLETQTIEFFMDSELVVKQLNGIYKIKSRNLLPLFLKVKELVKKLPVKVLFTFVYREHNKDADSLVNKEIDENTP